VKLLRVMGCDSVQYGSMERYLVRLTQRAAERGHRSVIAYDSPPRVPQFVADVRQAGGELLSLERAPGEPWRVTTGRLTSLLRRERPEVLHGYFTPFCHLAMASGAALGIRRRYRTSANMPWSARSDAAGGGTPTAAFCLKQRWLARLPRRIVALSGVMKEEFLRLGVDEERVVVIHGGVDSEHFTPDNLSGRRRIRAEWAVAEDARLVGFVGRLVPIKAVDLLLTAASQILHNDPRARFVIVGDGPLRGSLEEQARALGLGDRCHFAGHRTDTRDVLAALDVLALCSLSEGMSNSLLEAMATGLPVVASAIPANAEVVGDRATGLLFPLGDTRACAHALQALLRDDHLALTMGQRGRERVERNFSLERRVAAELDLYETVPN
jgi:glycosyltransferase involved in cell wall biosynthesis